MIPKEEEEDKSDLYVGALGALGSYMIGNYLKSSEKIHGSYLTGNDDLPKYESGERIKSLFPNVKATVLKNDPEHIAPSYIHDTDGSKYIVPSHGEYHDRAEIAPEFLAAHEYGHAQDPGNIVSSKLKKIHHNKKYRLARSAATLAAPIVAAKGGDTASALAVAAPILAHLPTLAEEARASKNALKAMKKTHTKDQLRKAKKKMALMYGTHLAIPLTSSAISFAIRQSRNKEESQEYYPSR